MDASVKVGGRYTQRGASVYLWKHSFISEKSADALGCEMEMQSAFDVMIGDRNFLKCVWIGRFLILVLQGNQLPIELYTLAITGADQVLRIHWLKSLLVKSYGTLFR